MTLGKDSWWADKIDISVLFPGIPAALALQGKRPARRSDPQHGRSLGAAGAASPKQDKTLAGLKVICAPDGSFLPPERFSVPSLNDPGHYQNGGYWPMYTLIALALRYKLAPDKDLEDAHRNPGARSNWPKIAAPKKSSSSRRASKAPPIPIDRAIPGIR